MLDIFSIQVYSQDVATISLEERPCAVDSDGLMRCTLVCELRHASAIATTTTVRLGAVNNVTVVIRRAFQFPCPQCALVSRFLLLAHTK